MAKIVNESLIPSAKNAPLDARTEIETLEQVESIQNPSPSLIFYVKENGQHYKVTSFKEVAIAGTSLTKKVIGSYEPIGTGDVTYDELGDVNLDGVFDQMEMDTVDVGDVPAVDFSTLE